VWLHEKIAQRPDRSRALRKMVDVDSCIGSSLILARRLQPSRNGEDFERPTEVEHLRVIKQEDPAECIRCGKPFGVKSSVERVVAKLEGKHWMYKDSKKRLDVIRMCEDCRVVVMAEEQFDPFGAPKRPPVRTTEDYLREREQKGES